MKSLAGCWIVLCALVVAAGWVLSALHALNVRGYLLAGVFIVVLIVVWVRRKSSRNDSWNVLPRVPQTGPSSGGASGSAGGTHGSTLWLTERVVSRLFWRRRRATCRRRFRSALPLAFLILAVLAVLGGFLHPPNNYDAMTYRVPRMLNWTSAEQWHWIHTLNERQNNRAQGYEWLSMPLLVFTKTDRAFFLINAVSFALLPGLIFSAFTRLGVRTRVAWSWMWLLPSGYSLVLQAGGISNDMVAVPFALAALDFALRAQRSRGVADAWLSLLAAALLTGVKGSNLPLLLPWAIALAPSWRLLARTPARSVAVIILAGTVSFLPTALLNHRHCGDWSGAALEVRPGMMPSPALAFGVNGAQLLAQHLAPPVFPLAGWWNAHVMGWLPTGLRAAIEESNFRGAVFNLGELPVEDTASPGFGLTALVLVSLVWVFSRRRSGGAERFGFRPAAGFSRCFTALLVCSPWVSLAVYMAKVATTCAGRLITPYFPLLLVGLLSLPGWEALARNLWWRRLAVTVMWFALAVVIANPARPIWPAQAVLAAAQDRQPGIRLVERAVRVYGTYARRHDVLAPIHEALPAAARRVGLAGSLDHPEASLWRPFGSRTIVHVLPGDTPAQVRAAGVAYVVLTPEATEHFQMPLAQWLREYHAELVRSVEFAHLASQAPQRWHVVRVLPAHSDPPPP